MADDPVGFLAGADWTDGGDVAEGMSLAYDGSLRPPPGSGYNIEATEDLDGDGRPEWVMDDQFFDHVHGRIFIVKGFDIPWDDPSKW